MARPPRIPVMLPWECKVIYFITLCVAPRCNALANDAAWTAICETVRRLDKWNTYCTMVMPDHIHLLTAPLDRELSVAAFLKWFKRWFNESYGARETWGWQPGGFDRLLRTSESVHEKWNYIRENPVRAGLVAHWKQWPHQRSVAQRAWRYGHVMECGASAPLCNEVSPKKKTVLSGWCEHSGCDVSVYNALATRTDASSLRPRHILCHSEHLS